MTDPLRSGAANALRLIAAAGNTTTGTPPADLFALTDEVIRTENLRETVATLAHVVNVLIGTVANIAGETAGDVLAAIADHLETSEEFKSQ